MPTTHRPGSGLSTVILSTTAGTSPPFVSDQSPIVIGVPKVVGTMPSPVGVPAVSGPCDADAPPRLAIQIAAAIITASVTGPIMISRRWRRGGAAIGSSVVNHCPARRPPRHVVDIAGNHGMV